MALTDATPPSRETGFSNNGEISSASSSGARQTRQGLERQGLSRLPELHAETSETARLAVFAGAAVHAAAALMILGALAAATSSTLSATFAWALLLLVGICALLRSYIRSTAAAFDRLPLQEAAAGLRAILSYVGFAWGAGAFLALPAYAGPSLLIGFAVLPSLAIAWLMQDRDGVLAFIAPVAFLSAAAAILRPLPDMAMAACLTLLLEAGVAALVLTRSRAGQARVPAGLQLG